MSQFKYPKRMSQRQIAAAFGCTRQAVAKWDCPRNSDGSYNITTVIQWRVERAVDQVAMSDTGSSSLEEWRRGRVTMLEMDIAYRQGELVERAEVLRQIRLMVADVKSRFLLLPRALAPRCSGKSTAAVAEILDAGVRGVLDLLAKGESAYEKENAQ